MQGADSTLTADAEATLLSGSLSKTRGHPLLLLGTLTAGQMAQGLAFTSFVSALPQMARDLGPRGEFVAQMTVAVAALGILLGALTSGWILEKAGTRRTFLYSMVIFGAAGAGGMFLRNPALLLTTRFAVGFVTACLVTTCLWGIAAEYVGHRRASVLGIVNAAGSAIALAGTLVGGLLARVGGWPLTFVAYPIFAAITIAMAMISLPQVIPPKTAANRGSDPFFLRLLPMYCLTTWLFIVIFMGSTQYAFLLQADGITDPALRSVIMGLVPVASTLISFGYGKIQPSLGMKGTFLAGVACATLSLVVIGLCRSGVADLAGSVLLGAFVGLATPYVFHAATERTSASNRGRALGMVNAFAFLGAFLNPVILAPLGRAVGLHHSFLAIALAMALLGVGSLFARSS